MCCSKKQKKYRKRKTMKRKTMKKYYMMVGCNKKCKCKCTCHRKSHVGGNLKTFVGNPYTVESSGNYYSLPDSNAYNHLPRLKGGNVLPSNLVNVARQMGYGAQSVYNGLAGHESPTDPSPYVQNKI